MKLTVLLSITFFGWAPGIYGSAMNVDLGNADSFAVLAGSAVTNTGSTTVHGDLGGTTIDGFPPGLVSGGALHLADATLGSALESLNTAIGFAAGEACGTSLQDQDLGGLTLTPGVYCFSSSAQLTGTLTLNALGNSNAVFLFQIGSALTASSGSSVVFLNGGEGDSLFWQVGSSASLGSTAAFAGNILAQTSITLATGASLGCGRALAHDGSVTLAGNAVSTDGPGCETTSATVPEPGTGMLLGVVVCAGMLLFRSAGRRGLLRHRL